MTTQEIADLLSGELVGDGSVRIERIGSLKTASSGTLAFSASATDEISTDAACVLVPENFGGNLAIPFIKVHDPKLAFARVAESLLTGAELPEGFHPAAWIDPGAAVAASWMGTHSSVESGSRIAAGCLIHPGVRIGRNVTIEENTVIFPNCVIYDDVSIGRDCVLHGGVVVGAPGFGYVRDGSGEYHQFPQIGNVVIEHRVEIGANTCIDRGALGETRIGEGTKIDNLVQVGHNVQIGKRCVIAAQTGISGSVIIEDDCVIGGQVGFGDHVRVQSGSVIGSQAGILPGKIVRPGVWWGTPIQPLDNYKRQNAMVKGLPRLKEEIRQIKDELARLKGSDD